MKTVISILVLVVIVGALLLFEPYASHNEPPLPSPEPVFCTMDAKICPDGSAVGRVGPNCEFAQCPNTIPTTSNVPTIGDIVLGIGQTGNIGALNMTLNEIVEDSRCPADVQCVWAGLVQVRATFANANKSEVVELFSSQTTPHAFDGYEISIISVAPSKNSDRQILASEYRVTFKVTKK